MPPGSDDIACERNTQAAATADRTEETPALRTTIRIEPVDLFQVTVTAAEPRGTPHAVGRATSIEGSILTLY
jgi:hypothetical protein